MHKKFGQSDERHDVGPPAPLINSGEKSSSGIRPTAFTNHNSNASNVSGSGNTVINNNPVIVYGDISKESDTIQAKIASILKPLHVPQAVYGAQIEKGCMKDTRVQVLRDIEAWIKDFKGPQIFWLTGMAGTGKSAIAWSISSRANGNLEIILGGSFFCSRSTGVSGQRDVRCMVPTLAQLMARQSVEFAKALAVELALDPDVLHQQVGVQVEKLLYNPLLALKDSLVPIVFVIDALDECGGQLTDSGALDDEDTHRIVSDMLEALVAFSESSVRLPVKFFVTSRPETHIRDTHVSDHAFSKVLRLHTVDKQQVTSDIRLYITNRLFATPTLQKLFTEDDIAILVGLCNGLFIVAATALGHALGAGVELARARFNSLLNASGNGLGIGVTEPLDRMYAVIVEDAAKVGDVEANQLTTLLRVLAALLSARMSLSVAALAGLLDIPIGQLHASMTRLHAVIHVPDDDHDASLRPIHASFGDYLFGRALGRIRISESLGHEALTYGCLHVLANRLYFNVSQSRSSFEPNSAARPSSITLSIEYACLQWIYHVSALLDLSKNNLQPRRSLRSRLFPWSRQAQQTLAVCHYTDLEENISTIFCPRMLFWLEVMSVLGQVQRAAAMLMFAAATVREEELARFLRDANLFVASSQEVIRQSASHIYLSALPLADKNSLVYQKFAPMCTGLISINQIGVSHHARRLLMTLTGHEGAVNSVAYSFDSRLIISGSADGTVRIWDMRGGEEMMTPLRSGDGVVRSVTISPDCKSVVSGTDSGVVCIWSLANTHIAARRLISESGAVTSVLYSPNGSCLATSSPDNIVRLWDAVNYQQLYTLRCHTGKVRALAFSSDSLTLATGSEDHTIQLWDVATGKPRYKSPHRHQNPIYSLCFLPDGQKIVAGSGHNIMLCKPQTEKGIVSIHSGWNPVLSVKPSPDGLSLVSAHGNNVCLSTIPRNKVQTSSVVLDGHTETVRAATFSHNGLYIASASDDHTIRIWNASNRSEVQPAVTQEAMDNNVVSALIMTDSRTLTGHTDYVESIAVSPDGAVIVSGSDDKSVRIWDAQTGAEMLSPQLRHTRVVHSIAISSDGRLAASGSLDCTVRLWDLQTGNAVGEPMSGHSDAVRAVVFSPDARWLASGSDDMTVRIWDVATQQPSAIGPHSCQIHVHTVAISPDGRLVAAGDWRGCLSIWQSDTGQPAREQLRTGLSVVFSIGFSPDGTRILSGGDHNTEHVRILNITTGEQVFALTGHTDTVYSAMYSPDGWFIGTGSGDNTVRLWDAVTGAPIALLAGHSNLVQSVAFTPDSRYIVSGSYDNTIQIWGCIEPPRASLVSKGDAAMLFPFAKLDNGWLQTRFGELLLWVPAEYHKFLYKSEGSRVIIQVGKSGLNQGDSWTSCWRGNVSGPGLSAGSRSS